MAKSTSQPKPTHSGTGTKGDGGRNVPKPSTQPSQPSKTRSNEGAPGVKPPKSGS